MLFFLGDRGIWSPKNRTIWRYAFVADDTGFKDCIGAEMALKDMTTGLLLGGMDH